MTTLASVGDGPVPGAVMEERRPSIAVVDDDSGFAGYLRTFLALRGYEARSYTRGDEIVAAGQFFHTGTKVVLWIDPGGYDAYRVERRFAPIEKADWRDSTQDIPKPTVRGWIRRLGVR